MKCHKNLIFYKNINRVNYMDDIKWEIKYVIKIRKIF